MSDLSHKKCVPCEGGVSPLSTEASSALQQQTPEWVVNDDNTIIKRRFAFKNFLRTMSFVNAVAWIANQENHHPDMKVGYNYCEIDYATHAIGGLSENDFICAKKIDALLD